MKSVAIKLLLGLLVQSATSSALLQISSDTLLDEEKTISGDITVNAGSSLMINHDAELSIESGTIANNGNLCIGTTDTVSEMSIDIVARNINNKGNLIIDNGDSGDTSTKVTIGSLINSGFLRMNLKDSSESFSVTKNFINSGYILLGHVSEFDSLLTFEAPKTGIQNNGTIDVSGTNVTINAPITGGGCIYGNSMGTDLTIDTDYSLDQTFWMESSGTDSKITLLGSGKNIPIIRGFGKKSMIVLGRNIPTYNGTLTQPSYDPATGIVTISNMYGTFRIDIGKGYDGSKISAAEQTTCGSGSCYAPSLQYNGVEPAAATERPAKCAANPDLSMAVCSTCVSPSSSSAVFSSQHSTSSSVSVPATSIQTTSSAVAQHTVSKGTSSTTNDNGQCVVTEISTEYFSTLHTTTYFYTTASTITAPVTSTFITTTYSKV
ncbi:uncharacterized protein NDAI_0H01170 [Naumovozyma dairenensis CBS 421]|uniref:Hyphally-regulated cell wall protein N-terminal domain-containing protein n=1 Tax=Naumovozyma dairenensis (strain ATCC 10597 / BCRC 20456 / CBS 421 / NBRC 0211 / NRRL Y-12639) TaxID=1071378 RepID=G0WET0_NAUDC|nr:hypothetical protein NDAI_0H01170 [Naumovozyma dairenensis CBS 421]CCD26291.1 hypothetical protein NDAI_0H01170 [Naumovozyma dairenensis CBS 421]